MKKLLLMSFVAMAMMVSCSKDDSSSTSSEPATLKGTLWEANQAYNIPILGQGTMEVQLYFKTEDLCRVDIDLPATLQGALSTLGIGDLDSGEYGYTFDGKKVVFDVRDGIELEYKGSTLVYHIPSQYSAISTYIGGTEIVFRQQ